MKPPQITGMSRIGTQLGKATVNSFSAADPERGEELSERFYDASPEEIDEAMQGAERSARPFRAAGSETRARFLDMIAEGLQQHGQEIIARATRESGLPTGRVTGELGRTTNQLRMFAGLVREGSWAEAVIVTADPSRTPTPRPDLRKLRVPIGPVVVFAASNFPLAFSVAGGDTASALAAGNPVVVKAHPGHPGTSELVADVILNAAADLGLPDGVFSLVHGADYAPGLRLVTHRLTRAVAFTGSFQGGMALYRKAQEREHPIPVFAEMGSINPVFVLPGIMQREPERLGPLLAQSITLGAGQFCTKPGVIVVRSGEGLERLREAIAGALRSQSRQTMLNFGIAERFARSRDAALQIAHLEAVYDDRSADPPSSLIQPPPYVGSVDADEFLEQRSLHREVFGPFALLVVCSSSGEMLQVAEGLDGQLTITLHGTDEEVEGAGELRDRCQERAGRLILGGVPTGVEVCAAMQHGGPFPATTDSRFTSVGTAAIQRFSRPVSFQNWGDRLLPEELQDANPRGILREVDGEFTRDPIDRGHDGPNREP